MEKIIFENSTSEKILLLIEPWMDFFWIETKQTIEIIAIDELKNSMEMEYSDGKLIIWCWCNDYKVMFNGQELEAISEPKV